MSVLILAFVVVAVTVAGGWFYYDTARSWLRNSDRQHAERMGRALGLAAQSSLLDRRNVALEHLAGQFIRNENVRYVALLDGERHVAAEASRDCEPWQWSGLVQMPLSVFSTRQVSDDVLTLALPVVARTSPQEPEKLVGAVRLVLDTSSTTENLTRVQHRMSVIAAACVISAIPLGYLLVWRVLVQPVRRLLTATRRLGQGDFTVRTELRRNDEIGELALAFDSMAEEVAAAREKLVRANESLEHKVAERTEELQLANRRLREEAAEKEDFLQAVSHDLNAPLRNIAGMATMVMMKWGGSLPEDVVARLQRIQANVDTEALLIGELLELSRIKSRPQIRQLVDMGELMDGLFGTFEFELKVRNISWEVRRPMPSLYVEKNRIRQVFQNLIDNAVKYIDRPKGGRIEVGYEFVEGMHRFCVADNGPGIAPDEQEKIFCIFRRGENAIAAKVPGKGVGLALVKSIVANYDGRASVQSEPGHGSRFCVALSAHCTRAPTLEESDELLQDQETEQAVHHPVGG
jgi:signal transduction histidine kinase